MTLPAYACSNGALRSATNNGGTGQTISGWKRTYGDVGSARYGTRWLDGRGRLLQNACSSYFPLILIP
jgi:hypothetical protein